MAAAGHGRRDRAGVRPLGVDDEARAGPRHLQLRLALVPHAVRGGHRAEPLRHRHASHRHGLHELVLPAELGAAARGRDAADGARHAVAVPQLRVAGDRLPGRLVHRQALRPRASQRGRGRDPARGHMLVVREPGAAKNDLVAAALLLAAIAILVTAWESARARRWRPSPIPRFQIPLSVEKEPRKRGGGGGAWRVAGRLAAGRRWARRRPRGRHQGDGAGDGGGAERRGARAGAGGAEVGRGRLVVRAGAARRRLLVPAQPDRRRQPAARDREPGADLAAASGALQVGRPDFSIAHYATDTDVWRDYFFPGLHDAFGALWPLVVGGRSWRGSWPC